MNIWEIYGGRKRRFWTFGAFKNNNINMIVFVLVIIVKNIVLHARNTQEILLK